MPTVAELEAAMIRADKAGDTEGARILAGEIQKNVSTQTQPRKRRSAREPGPTPTSINEQIAQKTGFTVSPESDLGWLERALLGLRHIPEEKAATFKSMYPEGAYQTVDLPSGQEAIYQKQAGPNAAWYMADEPGLTAKDIADRPQMPLELAAQGAIGALGPAKVIPQILMQGAVPGGIHLAKEGAESLFGTQKESLGDVLGTAAGESATDITMGGIAGGLHKALIGPAHRASGQLFKDYQAIRDLQNLEKQGGGPGLVDPMLNQLRPDMAIAQRIGMQVGTTSGAFKDRLAAQQESLGDMVRRFSERNMGTVGQVLTEAGRTTMSKERDAIKSAFKVEAEDAGKALQGVFTDKFNKASRFAINQQYIKAGKMAEGVQFDLTGAQNTAKRLSAPTNATATDLVDSEIVDLAGKPLGQMEVRDFVNVAASPGEKVNRVTKLLSAIDPEQGNWEVIKELRSQVGEAIKDLPLEDASSGKAKAIYRDLTNSIENPIGGNKAFVDEWKTANDLAKYRFNVFEQGKVLDIIKKDSPSEVAGMIAGDPHLFTPVVRDVINKYAPTDKAVFRDRMKTMLLSDPGGSVKKIDNWALQNEAGFRFLFPTNKAVAEFKDQALKFDELKNAPIQQMLDAKAPMYQRGKQLIENMGAPELKTTVKQYGPKSPSVEAMRLAAFDTALNKAITTKNGLPSLDGKALSEVIRQWKNPNVGIWDNLLTKEDKIRLKGLDAYVRRVNKSGGPDAGASLEAAQAITNLKHPATFMSGVHTLAVNSRILAPLMMSETAAKLFKPKSPRIGTRKRFTGGPGLSVFTANLAQEISRLNAPEVVRE